MEETAREFLETLTRCFADLKAPWVQASCEHRFIDIWAITLLAVSCGADDWTDLETFGRMRHDWLKTFLKLPGGIPLHDTFGRVLSLLERQQFAACLFQWTQAIHEATGGKLLAIDGKALRRSFAKRSGKAMLHLVTAWASDSGLTLGQVACEAKSNEITAIPELLKLLNIKGCTVTIDAIGTQTQIAAQIREQKGHYVLAFKGNQSGLAKDMQRLFDQGMQSDFAGMKHDVHQANETGHGRHEQQTCHVIEIPRDHPQRTRWKDLRALVVTISCRTVDGQASWESRSYVSSHPPRAKMLAHAIRRHWSIENSQHWVLDVSFGEDACRQQDRRQQDRHGAANLAAVRRLTLSLLRQEPTLKRGAKCKRMACALDPQLLAQSLSHRQNRCVSPAVQGVFGTVFASGCRGIYTLTPNTALTLLPQGMRTVAD